jgi:hypothetical protein
MSLIEINTQDRIPIRRYLVRVMLSARWGLDMRGIGRIVAAIVLAGAVAGAAAFAHLLGSVPAAPSSVAALPPSPSAPLIVEAAPWSPRPTSAHHSSQSQAFRIVQRSFVGAAHATGTTPAGAVAGARTSRIAPAKQTAAEAASALRAERRQTSPAPPAATSPVTVTQPQADTPAPVAVAAPAPAPPVTTRALAQAAPVVAPATPALPTLAQTKSAHSDDHGSQRGYRRFENGNGGHGGNDAPTVVAAAPVTSPTPTPVVAIRPPSVGPPAGTETSVASPTPTAAPTAPAPTPPTATAPTVSPGSVHGNGDGSHHSRYGTGDDHSH